MFTIGPVPAAEFGSCYCCSHKVKNKTVYAVTVRLNENQSAQWRFCKKHLTDLREAIIDALDPLPPVHWNKKLKVKRKPVAVGWEKIFNDLAEKRKEGKAKP